MSIGSINSAIPDFAALRDRIQERGAEKFKSADTDASGGLSIEEFEKLAASRQVNQANSADKPSPADIFAKLDRDGDGELTKSEFKEGLQERTDKFSKVAPNLISVLLQAQEQNTAGEKKVDLIGQLVDSIITDPEEKK